MWLLIIPISFESCVAAAATSGCAEYVAGYISGPFAAPRELFGKRVANLAAPLLVLVHSLVLYTNDALGLNGELFGNLPAVAAVLVIWFGFSILPKVLVVVLIAFFPIAVNTVDGMKAAPVEQQVVLAR